jgi:hypothetical protein
LLCASAHLRHDQGRVGQYDRAKNCHVKASFAPL